MSTIQSNQLKWHVHSMQMQLTGWSRFVVIIKHLPMFKHICSCQLIIVEYIAA